MKLNLPMICKPNDWELINEEACRKLMDDVEMRGSTSISISLSDLSGGYLTHPVGYIQDRYSLVSSSNLNRFNINLSSIRELYNVCTTMNKLQDQQFKINIAWLSYILQNEEKFVEWGLLKPNYLCSVNPVKASALLREVHNQHPVISKSYRYFELLKALNCDIQIAIYEQRILKLAKAYAGYTFYLPAFLDFRGRIYRYGFIHFHERDLVRSLILLRVTRKSIRMLLRLPLVSIIKNLLPTRKLYHGIIKRIRSLITFLMLGEQNNPFNFYPNILH